MAESVEEQPLQSSPEQGNLTDEFDEDGFVRIKVPEKPVYFFIDRSEREKIKKHRGKRGFKGLQWTNIISQALRTIHPYCYIAFKRHRLKALGSTQASPEFWCLGYCRFDDCQVTLTVTVDSVDLKATVEFQGGESIHNRMELKRRPIRAQDRDQIGKDLQKQCPRTMYLEKLWHVDEDVLASGCRDEAPSPNVLKNISWEVRQKSRQHSNEIFSLQIMLDKEKHSRRCDAQNHYHLAMHTFGLLTTASIVAELDEMVQSAAVVFSSPSSGARVEKHFKNLQSWMQKTAIEVNVTTKSKSSTEDLKSFQVELEKWKERRQKKRGRYVTPIRKAFPFKKPKKVHSSVVKCHTGPKKHDIQAKTGPQKDISERTEEQSENSGCLHHQFTNALNHTVYVVNPSKSSNEKAESSCAAKNFSFLAAVSNELNVDACLDCKGSDEGLSSCSHKLWTSKREMAIERGVMGAQILESSAFFGAHRTTANTANKNKLALAVFLESPWRLMGPKRTLERSGVLGEGESVRTGEVKRGGGEAQDLCVSRAAVHLQNWRTWCIRGNLNQSL
ncbi:hypothetical protein E1301_Tti016251 [Triplophysa tibetana]|uniref:Uncharacterized protein n=1 Tax=Triplophysa tibetana TaxID=1572043 RepID=A0A5A9N8E5_9TELE|nr:hypothetical protein E1301_Tti016251 [Triplophysa tibetana]